MKQYALFKDGKQISKWHSTYHAAIIEAYEHGAIVTSYKDFLSEKGKFETTVMANGYEIKEKHE